MREPFSPAGISLDGSEVNRRTMESQLRKGLDENSPRFGDAPRNYRAAYLSSASSDSDDDSLHIALKPSPAKTVSPAKTSFRTTQMPSPVSMFDGMAKELRREFEKVTGGQTHRRQARTTLKESINNNNHILSSKYASQAEPRRVFGELSNQQQSQVPTARTPRPQSYSTARHSESIHPQATKQRQRESKYEDPFPIRQELDRNNLEAFDSPIPMAKKVAYKEPQPSFQYNEYQMPDVTGLTEGLASPEKGGPHRRLPSPRKTVDLHQNSNRQLENALQDLEVRLNNLENENDNSMRRVRQIEGDLDAPLPRFGRREVDSGIGTGSSRHLSPPASPPRLAATDQADVADLVERLHAHVARLSKSLSAHAHAVADLRQQAGPPSHHRVTNRSTDDWQAQIDELKTSIEQLSREVQEVKRLIESLIQNPEALQKKPSPVMQERPLAQHKPLSYFLQPEIPRPASAPLSRPALHPIRPTYASQPARPRYDYTLADLDPELRRAEEILKSIPKAHDPCTCKICHKAQPYQSGKFSSAAREPLPPQTMLSRALRDLEEDFASHKAIFVELSDAYKKLDPASNAHNRHALAEHLKESIEALEQKADQIKRLYDLLHYKEHPEASPFLR